ncbi:TetR/AcrR family transcriptional regulator [Cohnella endophytica]|uniref:TetR/AcrR family transcriptional regulator n=1 Tax=Cohnella endophytica TaxID=2419778 RepID=A0A494XBF8_9BACL|nr:TetR/AcrR family transcriptional regulator [Cohnella endophytica]RKP45474.1 TetR/AcrR family transcriptional regulator [Cohnella endophytica]
MQILKDEIRNKILEAAMREFKREGYAKASMREIAKAAGVTSGNIYRYFANKEQLFDAIVIPVYEQYTARMADMRDKIEGSYSKEAQVTPNYFRNIESAVVELFKIYSGELTILLIGSEGSKYENVRSELVYIAFSVLERVFIKANGSMESLNDKELALARMLARSIVEGLCLILSDNDEGDTLAHLVDQLLFVHATGIEALIHKSKS